MTTAGNTQTRSRTSRRGLATLLAAAVVITAALAGCDSGNSPSTADHTGGHAGDPDRSLHYAANDYGPHAHAGLRHLGYRLADISSASVLRKEPHGVLGLVYLGMCGGNSKVFRSAVNRYRHSDRLFGFYLMDEPAPKNCPGAHLRAESRYIHTHFQHARTFVMLQNMATWAHPRFPREYTRRRTGIDLLGLDPYPCRTELHGCDYPMINRYLRALKHEGVSESRIVPAFQAFGGGRWDDGSGGRWKLPTAAQATRIVCRWHALLPHPVFDYTYSWGRQNGDQSLGSAPRSLRTVFAAHNHDRLKC